MRSEGPPLDWVAEVSDDKQCEYLHYWSYRYMVICLSVLAAVGILGNLLSFLVFVTSSIRKKPIGLYLMTLAVSDSLVLLFEVLQRCGVAEFNNFTCKFVGYTRYSVKALSCYLITAIGLERCVMVTWPIHGALRASYKKSAVQIIFTVAFAFFSNIFMLFLSGLDSAHCSICASATDKYTRRIFLYTDFVFQVISVEIGTSLCLFITTIITVKSLISAKRKGRNIRESSSVRRPNIGINLTHMAIAVIIVFLLFRLPYFTVKFYDHAYYWIAQNPDVGDTRSKIIKTWHVLLTLQTANFAVNFLIYVTCWKTFRKHLRRLTYRLFHKIKTPVQIARHRCGKYDVKQATIKNKIAAGETKPD